MRSSAYLLRQQVVSNGPVGTRRTSFKSLKKVAILVKGLILEDSEESGYFQ